MLLITIILTTNNNQKWQLLNQTTDNIQRLIQLIRTFRLRRCNSHFFIGQCQQVISKTVTKVDNIQVSMWITLSPSLHPPLSIVQISEQSVRIICRDTVAWLACSPDHANYSGRNIAPLFLFNYRARIALVLTHVSLKNKISIDLTRLPLETSFTLIYWVRMCSFLRMHPFSYF